MADIQWKSGTKLFSVNAGTGRNDVQEKIINDVNDFINSQTKDGKIRNSQKTWFREPKSDYTVIICLVDYEEPTKK